MPRHLRKQIDKLKHNILALSALVEIQVERAVSSVQLRNERIAREVIDKDPKIDNMEVEVEEECLKILALYQPVAIDLRLIVAILKLNNDLERIGDLAVNIAERALALSQLSSSDIPSDILLDAENMATQTRKMLKKAMDALVNLDAELAAEVLAEDDEVDAINREIYVRIRQAIHEYPQYAESFIHLLSVSHCLERIADHATNIAEDVVYMVEGRIVRHQEGRFQ